MNGLMGWIVGVDAQELAADASIDYTAKLEALRVAGVQRIRIWLDPWFGGCAFESMYIRDCVASPPQYNIALGTWNDAYWSRVATILDVARAKRIAVEVTLFAPNNLDSTAGWNGTGNWPYPNSWNNVYNNLPAWGANTAGHFIPDFFTLTTSQSGYLLRDYQQAVVTKALSTLQANPGVYFEIANEFPLGGSAETGVAGSGGYMNLGCISSPPSPAADADATSVRNWQLNWISVVDAATSRMISVHAQQGWGPNTEGVNYYWGLAGVDILNFHFYNYDPQCISDLLHPAQTKGKVLSVNESGNYRASTGALDVAKLDDQMRLAWGMFISGGYFNLYEDDSSLIGDSAFVTATNRLKGLKSISRCLEYWTMSPVRPGTGAEWDSIVSGGPANGWQVMAEEGQQYFVYFWTPPGTGRTTQPARIQLPAGSFTFEWLDARNASLRLSGSISIATGQVVSIPSPPLSQWVGTNGIVLVLNATSRGATTCGPSVP